MPFSAKPPNLSVLRDMPTGMGATECTVVKKCVQQRVVCRYTLFRLPLYVKMGILHHISTFYRLKSRQHVINCVLDLSRG